MPDGKPQATPVWFNYEKGCILVNTAEGRVKDRNMSDRRNVAIVIMDLENPYRYIQIRGRVIEISTDGAREHLHELSRKYTGRDFLIPEGQVRKIFRIKPEKVSAYD
jgi:PPOX class probable F420-dependent enzyme